jgi:hypothetical protein
VPDLYFESHNYDILDKNNNKSITKNIYYMPSTKKIPLDLAFSRWMG